MSIPRPFSICKIRFSCHVIRPGKHSSFLGEGIRASWGAAIRRFIHCEEDDAECTVCNCRLACPYVLVYKPNLLTREDIRHIFPRTQDTKLSPPYVLDISNHVVEEPEHAYNTGEEFNVCLTLFGLGSVAFVPLFIVAMKYALEEGLHSGGFLRVNEASDYFTGDSLAPEAELLLNRLTPYDWTLQQFPDDIDGVTLRFHAPLGIARKKAYVTEVDLPLLIRKIAARAKSLTLTYSDQPFPDEEAFLGLCQGILEKGVFQLAQVKRYGKRASFGICGEMHLTGALAPLLPLLNLGSLIQVGKHVCIGYGAFSLAVSSDQVKPSVLNGIYETND